MGAMFPFVEAICRWEAILACMGAVLSFMEAALLFVCDSPICGSSTPVYRSNVAIDTGNAVVCRRNAAICGGCADKKRGVRSAWARGSWRWRTLRARLVNSAAKSNAFRRRLRTVWTTDGEKLSKSRTVCTAHDRRVLSYAYAGTDSYAYDGTASLVLQSYSLWPRQDGRWCILGSLRS